MLQQEKRVLFFDSGIGGLSIYQEVISLNKDIRAYYLFDHEFFPYGNKDETFLKTRVFNLLKSAIEKFDINLVVIACNTASTAVLPDLRSLIKVPIVGVVPAIKPACLKSKTKVVGLLATPGTCQREYTDNLIKNFNNGCSVIKVGSTDLVAIAENKICGRIVNKRSIEKIIENLFIDNKNMDYIVLGCTHFPFLSKEIQDLVGDRVNLIDSGAAIANRVQKLLVNVESHSHEKEAKDHRAFYTGSLEINEEKYKKAFSLNGFSELCKYNL